MLLPFIEPLLTRSNLLQGVQGGTEAAAQSRDKRLQAEASQCQSESQRRGAATPNQWLDINNSNNNTTKVHYETAEQQQQQWSQRQRHR